MDPLIVYQLGVETTKMLNNKQTELQSIEWTNGEANIDTGFSKLACDCCVIVWENMKTNIPIYNDVVIECSIPDINITFTYPNRRKSKHKIELKHSKGNIIPGSTIRNLDINQTLIFCKIPTNNSDLFELRCSQYHNAMGCSDTDLFQDRTPRPSLNFEKMKNIDFKYTFKEKECWVEHYANCALNRITKKSCKSWQDHMVKNIVENAIKEYVKTTNISEFIHQKFSL